MEKLKTFRAREDGAISVDWIVLTALMAAFAALLSAAMGEGFTGLADGIASFMTNWSFES